ncbi:MAG: glycosyltransferase, partial [Gemmataceae bacterium]
MVAHPESPHAGPQEGGGRGRVLAVTSELPWPLNSGGHLRTFHLLKAISARFDLRVVAGVESIRDEGLTALKDHGIDVRPAVVGRRSALAEAGRALRAAARREPYVLYRRHSRRAVWDTLRHEVRSGPPDLLYLDHLDSFLFRPAAPAAGCVIDLHNVYSTIAERSAEEQSRWWTRLYLRREAQLLRRVERRVARSADGLLCVSEEEADVFRGMGAGSVVVPNGVDCSAYASLPTGRAAGGPPALLYVGTMSWAPNAAAAEFLARSVLPAVQAKHPGARLLVIGRDPPAWLVALNSLPGVEVRGGVPDVVPFLREAHALVVPLESGGGTRLKILEAFAAGLPVVSTPVGCEGLGVTHGIHLLVAERPALAAAVLSLVDSPALGPALAERSRDFVRARFDWSMVGEAACSALHGVLSLRRGAATEAAASPTVVLDARVVVGAGGGPEKTILNSPRYLAEAGYRNLCVYMRGPQDAGFATLRDRAARLGAPLIEVDDRGPLDLHVVWQFLDLCRREKVAIWHGHDYKSNLLGLLLSRFWPMRLVTTLHGWVQQTARTPLYYAIDRFCLPRYERVLCVSPDLHEAALAAGVRPERCFLVENGIDLVQYTRTRTPAEAKRALGTD